MAWLPGWSYAKEISLTGQAGSGTLYQVELDIGASAGGDFHLEGHCTNFPQDIEVTDNDGTTLLDFSIEDITADPLKLWVEVADDLGSNQKIWVYYGKSGATTNSDIGNTFLFGDDFPGSSLDGGKWTTIVGSASVSGGECTLLRAGGTDIDIRTTSSWNQDVAYRCRLKYNTGAYNQQFGLSNRTTDINWGASDDAAFFYKNQTTSLHSFTNNETVTTINNNAIGDANYHIYDITWLSSQCKFYRDDGLLQTHTTNIPNESCYGGGKVRSFDGSQLVMDWMLVRKYNDPEPAFASAGAEQSAPAVGAIMNQFQKANIGADLYNGAIIA